MTTWTDQDNHKCTLAPTVYSMFKTINDQLIRQNESIERIAVTANDVQHLKAENQAQWKRITECQAAADQANAEARDAKSAAMENKWVANEAHRIAHEATIGIRKEERRPGDAAIHFLTVIITGVLVAFLTAATIKGTKQEGIKPTKEVKWQHAIRRI